MPGVEIIVEQERNGPPVGKAVNIEIRGDEFESLVKTGAELKRFLDNKNIAGVEELKSDFVSSKPELLIVPSEFSGPSKFLIQEEKSPVQ